MGHEDKGHYALKHKGKSIQPELSDAIKAQAADGMLPCAAAHKTAKTLGYAPKEAGVQADLLELCISQCQLGLFGYSPNKKKFNPDIDVPEALAGAILDAQDEGRLSCRQCWDMAKDHSISRLDMGSACEKMEIRIKPCQLGAF
ncbi:MAG: hypothetical protein MI863_18370 [Desulfobacterales bacterium]|nr:hypothetical protein [Desulfobacterales bacterium]